MYQSWHFWDKIGRAKSVGFRFYSAIWRSESRISSRYLEITSISLIYYFGGARSKGFATLRNVSKLQFFDKIGQAKSVGFRLYSAIWRSESRISSRYLEITSISLIYSLTFSRKKELLFWLPWGLNRLTCVTRQIRGDSKLRDQLIDLLRPKVVRHMKNSYEIMH